MSVVVGSSASSKVCCFCNLTEDNELELGKFYEYDGIITHYYCLLLSSNMEQKGEDDEGILGFLVEDIQKELRRGKRLVCSYCKKIGATLGCCNVKCKRIFHFPCGLRAGSLHQFFGEFRSYCLNHRPKQKIDDYIIKQISSSDSVMCYICYDKVNLNDFVKTLWAPCCKKDAWFHRECVQQLALSAGYFFKCPLCNNKKDFQKAMLEHGIFIPSQDASWELEPNAFEELLYRHNQCDALICLCPKGKKHTSSNAKWELVLCRTCGSQGIHMACGQLKWANPVWECDECASILRNSKDKSKNRRNIEMSSSSDSSSQSGDLDRKHSDSDDTDTDISVGTEYPVPLPLPSPNSSSTSIDSSIRLRPGPRSFKLQQMKVDRTAKWLLKKPRELQFASATSERNTTSKANVREIGELSSRDDDLKKDSLISEESKKNCSQRASMENDSEERKSCSKESRLNLNEEDVIVIESDDDDVEIIMLKRKIELPTAGALQSSITCSPNYTEDSKNTMENSAISLSKSSSVMLIDLPKTHNIDQKGSCISESKILSEGKSVPQQLDTIPSQESVASNDCLNNLEDKNAMDASNSVMNIKITNVTSLPPEVFASVPDVKENAVYLQANPVNIPSDSSKSLEKWFISRILSPKHGMYEEESNSKRKLNVVLANEDICFSANGHVAHNSKKIKRDSFDKTSTNSYLVAHIMNWQQEESNNNWHGETSKTASCNAESHEDTKVLPSKCVTVNGVSNSLLNIDRTNDSLTQSVREAKVRHAIIESAYSEGIDASNIIVQQANKSSAKSTSTFVNQSNDKFYLEIPPSDIYYATSIPNLNSKNGKNTRNLKNVVSTISSTNDSVHDLTDFDDTISPQLINNIAVINKYGIVSANNNQTGVLNKQEVDLAKKRLSDRISDSDNGPSNKIICDGDAGRTSPAVTPRSIRLSNTGTANKRLPENTEADSTSQRSGSSSEFCASDRKRSKRKDLGDDDTVCIVSVPSHSPNIRTNSVFPQVTNNQNACHQPRLIPQYMYLHDLKFRVYGSDDVQVCTLVEIDVRGDQLFFHREQTNFKDDNVSCIAQMILYDIFSVDVPVKNPTESKMSGLDMVRQSRKPAIISKAQDKALFDSDDIDSVVAVSHLDNDSRTSKHAIVGHDDAKENLDPVSKKLSCNDILNNISLVSRTDNTAINEYVCSENDGQTRFISSDTNLNPSNLTICNVSIDSNAGLILNHDHDQDVRIDSDHAQQYKQSVNNSPRTPAFMEKKTGTQFHNIAMRGIDFDFNVINANKNVEKVLQDDVITVSTSQHVARENGDGSPMLCLSNLSRTVTNGCKHLDSTSVVTHVSSIRFNEQGILNRRINSCGSKQFIRQQRPFHTVNSKIGIKSRCNENSHLKVSIDLCKVQNLIDSKPELFINPKLDIDDERRHKYGPVVR